MREKLREYLLIALLAVTDHEREEAEKLNRNLDADRAAVRAAAATSRLGVPYKPRQWLRATEKSATASVGVTISRVFASIVTDGLATRTGKGRGIRVKLTNAGEALARRLAEVDEPQGSASVEPQVIKEKSAGASVP